MTDPVYTYEKGKGWVIQTYPTLTREIGLYQVTLIHRMPEIGEQFWAEPMGYTLEKNFENIKGWDDFLEPGLEKISMANVYHEGFVPYGGKTPQWTVVQIEPL